MEHPYVARTPTYLEGEMVSIAAMLDSNDSVGDFVPMETMLVSVLG